MPQEVTQHSHVVGGSTAKRRKNCPGSLLLEKAQPDGKSSFHAQRGSMLHAAVELILTDDPMGFRQAKELAHTMVGEDLGFGAEHALTADVIDDKLVRALQVWYQLRREFKFDDWFLETQVSLDSVIPGAFGTADVIAKDKKGRIHVLDWKFGDGVPVPAKNNAAMHFYAAAVLYDVDPELTEFTADCADEVYFHIVQPKTGDPVVLHSWQTTWDTVEDELDALAASITLAREPDAPLKMGDWCQWCKAEPTCPLKLAVVTDITERPDTAPQLADEYSLGEL